MIPRGLDLSESATHLADNLPWLEDKYAQPSAPRRSPAMGEHAKKKKPRRRKRSRITNDDLFEMMLLQNLAAAERELERTKWEISNRANRWR